MVIGGGSAAGVNGNVLLLAVGDQFRVKAGEDDKLSAGLDGQINLFLGQHSTRTH